MRMVFLVMLVVLFELCSYVVARGLFWLVQPYLSIGRTVIILATIVISNLFLLPLFFGQFRLVVGYLAVLWLGVLAMLIVFTISFLAQKLMPFSGWSFDVGIRLFGVLIFGGLLGLSVYNAYSPTVRHLSIQIDKPMANPVRLAMVSDLRLGSLFGARQLHQLADILRTEKVDTLLIPGDIMDDNTKAYEMQNMKSAFGDVVRATKNGVFASLGNHDLYDIKSRQAIVNAVRATKTVLLDDKVGVFEVGGVPLSIIGRYDDHVIDRKTTTELMAQLPKEALKNPVILLDHRPSQIDDNVALPIDLQVSGHTHHGQVFPANLIVKILYRVAYGHEKIDSTHIIVSSGYGFWGVPFRLGSQSEIWVIEMHGKHQK
ncbi:metallophosphoesterase [Moraxella sp. Pampa]|uniref:metallophosphoesterase n=1 Tax=Moraxella sp. Pampa TaxID=3111978 RepID=UPI002B40BD64|nr:metallophosphoesterase [Moraxella sp. Pampa]